MRVAVVQDPRDVHVRVYAIIIFVKKSRKIKMSLLYNLESMQYHPRFIELKSAIDA